MGHVPFFCFQLQFRLYYSEVCKSTWISSMSMLNSFVKVFSRALVIAIMTIFQLVRKPQKFLKGHCLQESQTLHMSHLWLLYYWDYSFLEIEAGTLSSLHQEILPIRHSTTRPVKCHVTHSDFDVGFNSSQFLSQSLSQSSDSLLGDVVHGEGTPVTIAVATSAVAICGP